MRTKHILSILAIFVTLPMSAQLFNFALRTNNQQLIDKALEGAFVKINQSYELCDTVKDEHFGRNGKDYFSIVPFIGVETEKGLIFPSATFKPWAYDKDFIEYKGQYKPIVTKSKIMYLNCPEKAIRSIEPILDGEKITEYIYSLNDSAQSVHGLKVDSLPGKKDGWLIWISSETNLSDTDSVRFNSIKKEIEVPVDGKFLNIEKPDISETVYGGIFVTPIQSGVGQLSFTLTGVLVSYNEGWVLDFPFIKAPKESKALTPIESIGGKGQLNPFKKKKR